LALSFDGDKPRNNGSGQLQFGREANHKYFIYKLWTQYKHGTSAKHLKYTKSLLL